MSYNDANTGIIPVLISKFEPSLDIIGHGYYDDRSYETHGGWDDYDSSQNQLSQNNLQIELQPQENRTQYNRGEQPEGQKRKQPNKSGDGPPKRYRDNQR